MEPGAQEVPEKRRDTRGEVILEVEDLRCLSCAERVLDAVRGEPGVTAARLDYGSGELRVDFDPGATNEDRIRAGVHGCGYRCADEPGTASTDQLAHTAQMAPITLSLIH